MPAEPRAAAACIGVLKETSPAGRGLRSAEDLLRLPSADLEVMVERGRACCFAVTGSRASRASA
jgi:hypothetical protein